MGGDLTSLAFDACAIPETNILTEFLENWNLFFVCFDRRELNTYYRTPNRKENIKETLN